MRLWGGGRGVILKQQIQDMGEYLGQVPSLAIWKVLGKMNAQSISNNYDKLYIFGKLGILSFREKQMYSVSVQ